MMGWVCALPLAAMIFSSCGSGEPLAVGYVEGEYVLLAPIAAAQIVSLEVDRGDRLKADDLVATLETRDARLAVEEAEAAHLQAMSELENLKLGKRPQELAVLEATLDSAVAQARDARRSLERQKDLSRKGFASQANFDSAQTTADAADAKVKELEANLAVARLPARPAEIAAADQHVRQAMAALQDARWRLSKRTIRAPASGEVADIILRVGEIASPTSPVVSFLPDGATKLKLYLPEPALAGIMVGARLLVNCDGCAGGQTARVSYISKQPEFTPPVIYSLNNRQKLVYLVEARPDDSASRLKPGQIVDVRLDADAETVRQ